MPTKNRRVATYLPKKLDDRLKEFITERGLKGDSPALIEILSEYFGVAYPATQKVDYSGFVRIEQFQELADKVFALEERLEASSSEDNLLGKLSSKMRQMAERLKKVEAIASLMPPIESSSSDSGPAIPGQMNLLPSEGDIPSEPEGELLEIKPGDATGNTLIGLQPMKSPVLSKRFKLNEKAVINAKTTIWKKDPEKFLEWTRKRDPDGVGWQYNPDDKLFHPVVVEEEF